MNKQEVGGEGMLTKEPRQQSVAWKAEGTLGNRDKSREQRRRGCGRASQEQTPGSPDCKASPMFPL